MSYVIELYVMLTHLIEPLIGVQHFIHLSKERIPITSILGEEHRAEADAEPTCLHKSRELLSQLFLDAASNSAGLLLIRIGQENYEFIAAIAGNKAGIGQRLY